MKQLFWKEWYELRLVPLAAAGCVVVLIFAARVFEAPAAGQPFQLRDTFLPLLATWIIFGLLTGAGLIAQEVGSGGLQFLSALPTSRRQIWWVKVGTALGMLLLSVVSSALVWAVIGAVMFHAGFFHDPLWQMPALAHSVGADMLALLGCFSIALAMSPFLDRSISAAVAALLFALAYFALLGNLAGAYVDYYGRLYGWQGSDPHSRNADTLNLLLIALSIPLFGAVSYWTFTRGETLRSAKRFRVGALAGAVSLTIIGLLLLTGNRIQLW